MRELKVLCIQLGFGPQYPDMSTLATTYNDGIYYVASFLQRAIPQVQIEMCQMFWGEDPLTFEIGTYDYILVSALGTHFWSNLQLLETLQARKREGARIIMGGPHATFAPYEALKYADFVVLGEGEIPTVQLIEALESGEGLDEVENLCYLDGDQVLVMNRFVRYGNLDNTIDPSLLKRAPRLHWATVSMSRGCPFNCSFCYAIRVLGRRFRAKSLKSIVTELDGIHQQTGCSRFYVTDLNFTTRPEFCASVAYELRHRNYHFIAMSRIEVADDTTLLLGLKEVGFQEYCLGVESENAAVLKAFNKSVDASRQMERLLRLAQCGIYTHSAIIFGLDSQDLETMSQTARWCAEARIMHPTFVCLAEYPFQKLLFGSRQDVEDHRIIMEIPTYQHYSFVGIFPRRMRPSRLQQAILDSYQTFFKRALEIEQEPQRRMRLKCYARSVAESVRGMKTHIEALRKIEAPYYSSDEQLDEDMLKDSFERAHGHLRKQLETSIRREPGFLTAFKA